MTVTGCCRGMLRSGEPCWRRAKTAVYGVPMCTRHAAIAERKAAEAVAEAVYWEKMFTPRPGQPYRADPEWQAAKRESLDDIPGENDNDGLVRRISALFRLREIERRYGNAAPSAGPAAIPRS